MLGDHPTQYSIISSSMQIITGDKSRARKEERKIEHIFEFGMIVLILHCILCVTPDLERCIMGVPSSLHPILFFVFFSFLFFFFKTGACRALFRCRYTCTTPDSPSSKTPTIRHVATLLAYGVLATRGSRPCRRSCRSRRRLRLLVHGSLAARQAPVFSSTSVAPY